MVRVSFSLGLELLELFGLSAVWNMKSDVVLSSEHDDNSTGRTVKMHKREKRQHTMYLNI